MLSPHRRAPDSWAAPETLAPLARALSGSPVLLVRGPAGLLRPLLAAYLALRAGEGAVAFDGAGGLDPYLLARAGALLGAPDALDRVLVARAFTPWQMVALLEGYLPAEGVAAVYAPAELCAVDVARAESRALILRSARALRAAAGRVLVLSPTAEGHAAVAAAVAVVHRARPPELVLEMRGRPGMGAVVARPLGLRIPQVARGQAGIDAPAGEGRAPAEPAR